MVGSGDLHGDGTEGSGRITRTEDVLLSEAIPVDGGQDSHRGHTRLLQGVVALRGDGEPARCAQRLTVGNTIESKLRQYYFHLVKIT